MLKWIPFLEVISSTVFNRYFGSFLDDLERQCTMEDIEQMTYLDCVIKVNDRFMMN